MLSNIYLGMETPKPITGPYRATRLWNEAIRIFNNGMPRKRHWRQLKHHENCFTASEATSWLHSQLKVNLHFGPTVTKDQIQQLLCKFLKAGVFEDVRGGETKVEQFKENSGLYRLTNRSPFRNPRTPGRTPLSSVANRGNVNEECGSPKLTRPKINLNKATNPATPSRPTALPKSLANCQVTSRQLNREQVEEIWKSITLKNITNILGVPHIKGLLDPSQLKGKWVLWNVTRIGSRGVVQAMEELESPPTWALYGMKSLVNWPGNDNHKLPEYSGSEKDVFKVICDYFTNASGPLTTFSLYNLLVEAFVRVEACDIHFRKSKEQTDEEDDSYSLSSRGSVQSLVMKMASPAVHCKTSTPLGDYSSTQYLAKPRYSSLPVVKSPVVFNRPKNWRATGEVTDQSLCRRMKLSTGLPASRIDSANSRSTVPASYFSGDITSSSACYETAFTSVEPQTRIIPQRCATILRRSRSSENQLDDDRHQNNVKAQPHNLRSDVKDKNAMESFYRSLDRLRSKSGGYVNVAAFGSADCLDRIGSDSLWYPDDSADTWTSRSVSTLSGYPSTVTGLSPPTLSDYSSVSSSGQFYDYQQLRGLPPHVTEDSPHGHGLRLYQNSPSKRLIGRRKGLEFYYGAKACRPGLVTPEGKAMAIESLQLLTLLLPPDHRRKLHLLLRFMAKVTSNTQLVLDNEIPMKTLMINTFYRCIICSPDETDYDELLAVRLVTFLMENAEAIMVVPHRLCTQVRDTLIQIQREKV